MIRVISVSLIICILSGCANMGTKQEAFPAMYTDRKPVSMLIVPAINESTAADAGDLLNVTVTQPFSDQGYYVMPMLIVADIFRREGILEGIQIKGLPTSIFKKNFGADSVLFMTIESWDRNYSILAGNVTVSIEYVLLSTETNEILWSYDSTVVVNTSGSSGNILVDLVTTALATGLTDYVPVASQVHETASEALPFGKYHPKSGLDGMQKSVDLDLKNEALE
jgi:hypothetical protein